MKLNIDPIFPDQYYHIYNCGINGENIFKEERNYKYFLQKYAQFVEPVADTYAYCLMKNHYHFLVKTKTENDINEWYKNKLLEKENRPILDTKPTSNKTSEWIISNAFASFLKSYAQSINNGYKRSGCLFVEPFRRILVENEEYLRELILYIHYNPQKHGFIADFSKYKHSSYFSLLQNSPTLLKRDEVINWFGNKHEFEMFHLGNPPLLNFEKYNLDE